LGRACTNAVLRNIVRPFAVGALIYAALRAILRVVVRRTDSYALVGGGVGIRLLGARRARQNTASSEVVCEIRASTACRASPRYVLRVVAFGAELHATALQRICVVARARRALADAQVGRVVREGA